MKKKNSLSFKGTSAAPVSSSNFRSEEFYLADGEERFMGRIANSDQESEDESKKALKLSTDLCIAKAEKSVKAGTATPNELMLSVLPMIIKVCKKAVWGAYDENLFNEYKSNCVEEVLKAAKTFDASKGVKFSTYAFKIITFATSHALKEQLQSDPLAKKVFDAIDALRTETLPNGIEVESSWTPSIKDIKEYFDEVGVSISEDKIARILHTQSSLNEKVGDEEDTVELADLIAGQDDYRIYGEAPTNEELEEALFWLCKKNRTAADKVYLFCVEGLDYSEIADIYHVTDKAVGTVIRAFKESLRNNRSTHPGQVVENAIRTGIFNKCVWSDSDRFDQQTNAA